MTFSTGLLAPEAVEGWCYQTGKDFVFAWKASKFITLETIIGKLGQRA